MEKELKSNYFRELKPYSFNDFSKMLNIDKDRTSRVIKLLKEYGVLKSISKNNLRDDDNYYDVLPVREDDGNILYKFSFVGVLVANGCIIKCYPKYIHDAEYLLEEKMQMVVRVIETYNRKNDKWLVSLNDFSENKTLDNRIGLILYLLQDYYDYGIYKNPIDIIENNGKGKILWNKTINNTYPIIKENRPYYLEIKTKKSINNENDYITRLHQYILNSCSEELDKFGLFSVFNNYTPVNFDDNALSDFGNIEYVYYRIEKELSTQYNTRKQLVLKAMYSYLKGIYSNSQNNTLYAYGTTTFHVIWESVCKDVFLDKLNSRQEDPFILNEEKDKTYKELIPHPLWEYNNIYSDETLIPDIVMISNYNDKNYFTILDAKYYDVEFGDDRIKGQPGVESIVKQYAYYIAYKNKFTKDEYSWANCFLIPKELNDKIATKKKTVSFSVFSSLPKIQVILLDPDNIYKIYTNMISRNELIDKVLFLLYNEE